MWGWGRDPEGSHPRCPDFRDRGVEAPPQFHSLPDATRTHPEQPQPLWDLAGCFLKLSAWCFPASIGYPFIFLLALEKPRRSPGVRKANLWANKISLDSQERRDSGIQETHKHIRLESWKARLDCFLVYFYPLKPLLRFCLDYLIFFVT